MAPLFTPMLPASVLGVVPLATINPDLGAMLGWRHVADRIAAIYRSLPASQRAQAVIWRGTAGPKGRPCRSSFRECCYELLGAAQLAA
jgi:hypothetical protein